MSLHNGLDIVSWVSLGLYTETYGAATQANINNLFVSLGLLEDAPAGVAGGYHYWPNIWGWPWRKIWKSWG